MNGAGAIGTTAALVVVLVAKFEGAWVTVLLVGLLMVTFLGVRRHYRKIARRLLPSQ